MVSIKVKRKPFIVGVMGSHKEDRDALRHAYELGAGIAGRGHVLLTGGGKGVMRAASEGAHQAGGLVIAVLPSERKRPLAGYPNEFVDIPIYTGMYDARNIINAKTPHVVIALNGGPGTLSEIAVALKSGTPVIGLRAPHFELEGEFPFIPVSSVTEALDKLDFLLGEIRT